MPIPVICAGCKTAFQVSDKFAGKQGPCPKCKAIITIPALAPEIKIHAPETVGPKGSTGRPVFTPILREETVLSQTMLFAIIAAVVTVVLVALVVGIASRNAGQLPPLVLLVIGAIALAPPLGLAGYTMLRDQEAPGYHGRTLWIRVAASSAVYVILWAAFIWLPSLVLDIPLPESGTYSTFHLLLIVPIMVGIGALTAYVAYDLDFGQAAMHYGLYLAATVLLSLLAGVNWTPDAGERTAPKPKAKIVAVWELGFQISDISDFGFQNSAHAPMPCILRSEIRNAWWAGARCAIWSHPTGRSSPICNPQSAIPNLTFCNPQFLHVA